MSLSTFNLENEAAVKISTAHIRKLSARVSIHLSKNNLYLFVDDNGHTWHKSAYFDMTVILLPKNSICCYCT